MASKSVKVMFKYLTNTKVKQMTIHELLCSSFIYTVHATNVDVFRK